jgi:hypothetical protein
VFTENRLLFEPPSANALTPAADHASAVVSLIDVRGAAAPAASGGGLAELARQTGGRFVTHTDDLSGALAGVLADQLGYYLVGYEAGDADADLITGRPLPQHPVLTAARPGVELRSRNGPLNSDNFISDATRDDAWRPTFTTPASDLQRGLASPFASGGIPIQFVTLYSVGKAGPQVECRVHIDAKDLTYTRWLDGRTTFTLDIQTGAFGENGQSTQNGGGNYTMQLTPEQYKEALKNGFAATPKISIRAPGPYQVRVAVRDGTSGRIGSASQFVDVADFSDGQLAIPGINLAGEDNSPASPAALHVMKPGQQFRYTYQVVNLAADESKHSHMEAQTRILHNGTPIFEGQRTAVAFAPSDDSKLRTAGAEVRLGPGIEAGYYVLQIIVEDKLAKEVRMASQYVAFEVK